LEWLATRSPSDKIVTAAWLELGRLARKQMKFDQATDAFRQPINRYPNTLFAVQAAIELADLYNYRGMTGPALETIKPYLSTDDSTYKPEVYVKAGDACYRAGDYSQALRYYDRVSAREPEAALKSAWTSEALGAKEEALDKYMHLLKSLKDPSGNTGFQVTRRAAIITGELEQWKSSAGLWASILNRMNVADTSGRSLYEAAKSFVEAGRSVQSLARFSLKSGDINPWSDDLGYLAYVDTLRSSIRSKLPSAPDSRRYLAIFPASSYLDSARYMSGYFQRHCVRGSDLMERMAELSSRPPGSVDRTQWAMDWGDFYLFEFKDPVKALDQYATVIDDTSETAENITLACRRSLQAYLFLYESALWEHDDFLIKTYGDSARSRLDQLRGFNDDSPETSALTSELLRLDLIRFADEPERLDALLDFMRTGVDDYGADLLTPAVFADYLRYELDNGRLDSAALINSLDRAIRASNSTAERRTTADLRLLAVIIDEFLERYDEAVEIAVELVDAYPETPAGAEAVEWLVENPRLPPDVRYEWLETFFRAYPYLVEPVRFESTAAALLDSLDRPIDALRAREKAGIYANWGIPRLDILEAPDEAALYCRGCAFKRAGKLSEAADQFRILINLKKSGKYAGQADLALAEILFQLGDMRSALAYLDTLHQEFTNSDEDVIGMHLRPVLLMSLEDYGRALSSWRELISIDVNPDSLFHHRVEAVVCQYRAGRLEEARLSARQLYRDFKKRDDLDQYKALFYLEKGHALDKVRRFEEARDQYGTIKKS
ncbi:MAG TPA: tetratricopeptide repeat protein, partial [Bacteroidetes bacterium]|nr:tetratricopeptide repeat protein [Bacteroidota bacterium]